MKRFLLVALALAVGAVLAVGSPAEAWTFNLFGVQAQGEPRVVSVAYPPPQGVAFGGYGVAASGGGGCCGGGFGLLPGLPVQASPCLSFGTAYGIAAAPAVYSVPFASSGGCCGGGAAGVIGPAGFSGSPAASALSVELFAAHARAATALSFSGGAAAGTGNDTPALSNAELTEHVKRLTTSVEHLTNAVSSHERLLRAPGKMAPPE